MKTATPFVRKAGDARMQVVAGQVIHILAEGHETAGAFGAVICDSVIDPRPIPPHYHEHEHDTWFCLRGRLQVWAGDTSRVMTAGDFAYVPPGDVHSYQCRSPQTQFFGIVSPGGWEGFFDMAGDTWDACGLPEPGHPYDFSQMGPAMGKFDVNRVEKELGAAENGDETDCVLPDGAESYVLQAGYGPRARLGGHLITTMLSGAQSAGTLDMVTVEGGRGARIPAVRHETTHVSLFILDGTVRVTMGDETHDLTALDLANIPAGTAYSTEVVSRSARWIATGGNGNGVSLLAQAGNSTEVTNYLAEAPEVVLSSLSGIDAEVVE